MEFRTTDGTQIHAEVNGTGTHCVVFLHGWATTSRVWRPVASRWSGNERLIRMDLRGAGYSDKPNDAEAYTLETMSNDVIEFVQSLASPVTLIGHSMGGQIAQRVATLAPELLRRLILVSPVPASGVPLPEDEVELFKSLAGRREGMATILSSMLAGPIDDTILERWIDDSASVHPVMYKASLDMWRNASFADALCKLNLPTHVMCGADEQPLSPPVVKAAVADLIPGATFEVIGDCGHYPQYETPDVFTAALEAALQR